MIIYFKKLMKKEICLRIIFRSFRKICAGNYAE